MLTYSKSIIELSNCQIAKLTEYATLRYEPHPKGVETKEQQGERWI